MMTFSRSRRSDLALVLVGAVVVRRLGLELGAARVDGLVGDLDTRSEARGADLVLAELPEVAELCVAEPDALGPPPRPPVHRRERGLTAPERREVLALLDDRQHLVQEPRIDPGRLVDLLERHAATQQRLDLEDPVGRRDRGPGEQLRRRHLVELRLGRVAVEAATTLLERTHRLLERLGEGPPDRHDLADRLHLGAEGRLGTGELLEGPARHLGHDVVDRRLEARRGLLRDVVGDLVQGVPDGQLGGDLGDREARSPWTRAPRSGSPAGSSR